MKQKAAAPADLPPSAAQYRLLGAASALLAVSILLIHSPADLHGRNAVDFTFAAATLLGKFAWWAVAAMALLCLPLLAPWPRAVKGWAAACFAAALVVWVSTNFLVLDMGALDGRLTALYVPQAFMLTSLAVVAAVAAAAVRIGLRRPLWAAVAMLTLNAVLAAVTVFTVSRTPGDKAKAIVVHEDLVYRFSSNGNALVILLDTFQSDLFREIADRDPSFKRAFDGFVYYPDTLGAAASTYMSLPSIHSGDDLDAARPMKEIYQDAVGRRSFLTTHAKAGWEATLLNNVTGICPEAVACTSSEVVAAGTSAAMQWEYGHLLDLALFRAAPAPLKPFAFNGGAWRVRRLLATGPSASVPYRGLAILREMSARLTVSDGKPSAKMLHLFVTHPPVELDSDCRLLATPAPLTRDSLREQSRCAVEALAGLFAAMKHAGIYDNTAIAVIADHGAGMESTQEQLAPEASPGWRALVGVANPLLLFKPRERRGVMELSARKARIGDVGAMLCAESGACGPGKGIDVQKRDPGDRVRTYNSHRWSHEFWSKDVVPNVKTFRVSGPMWQAADWSLDGRTELAMGAPVRFSADADSERMLTWGWWDPEPWGVWSRGHEAMISFRVPPPARRAVRMKARVRGAVGPERTAIAIRVEANGTPVGEWRLDTRQPLAVLEATIPAEVLAERDGAVDVRLVTDPYEVKAGAPDQRSISFALESLEAEWQ